MAKEVEKLQKEIERLKKELKKEKIRFSLGRKTRRGC